MKLNRKLVLVVALLMSLALATTGTLAYMTDDDADINVMTVGYVEIVQNEQQRVEKDGEFTAELEPFEDNKILLPVTYPENRTDDTVTIGDNEITLPDKEANYVDKIVSATNIGNIDAYVRTLVAVPTGGEAWEPNPVAANDCWLHWNYPSTDAWKESWTLENGCSFIDIDGIGYYVWEFTHKETLKPGETTYPVIRGFYMDQNVDYDVDEDKYYRPYANGTIKYINDLKTTDTVKVYCLTQAVQADGFSDAKAALDASFGKTAVKAEQWFNGLDSKDVGSPGGKNDDNNPPASNLITNLGELEAALAKGGSYVFGNDIVTDGVIRSVADGVTLTLDMNGKTLEGLIYVPANATLTVENGSIVNKNADENAIETVGTVVLNNMNITSARHAVRVEGGKTTINGGVYKVESVEAGKTQHAVNVSDGGEVIITDGTFVGPKGTTADSGSAVNIQENSTGTITGGNFSGGMNATLASKGTLTVSGGTFDQDPTPYVAAGYSATKNDNTWTVGKNPPEGTVTIGYTSADRIWGDCTSNATESVVVMVYSGDIYMGKTSLNNFDGIIDGDVYATWSLTLNGEDSEYWNRSWETPPTKDMHATRVELWVDGTKVAENEARMNAPDDLNKIVGCVVDAEGKVLSYVVDGTVPTPDETAGEKYVAFQQ